jgi:hypothetical protein
MSAQSTTFGQAIAKARKAKGLRVRLRIASVAESA